MNSNNCCYLEKFEGYQYGRDFICYRCTLKSVEDDIFTNLEEDYCKNCEDYISKENTMPLIEW